MATLKSDFDVLKIKDFFDGPTCAKVLAEMRMAHSAPATVYRGDTPGIVDQDIRKTTRILPSLEMREFVTQRLLERKGIVEEHFRVNLSECEDPQFLRYGVGDYFIAHQDGNTGLIQFDLQTIRRVSVIIFLSNQSEVEGPDVYCGGSLVLHRYGYVAGASDCHLPLMGEMGTLVAFPPETTHEVIPVTYGERYSIASWFR